MPELHHNLIAQVTLYQLCRGRRYLLAGIDDGGIPYIHADSPALSESADFYFGNSGEIDELIAALGKMRDLVAAAQVPLPGEPPC